MSSELCKICNTREPHGYVQGTGEYYPNTCLPCIRSPKNRDNFIDGGDSKRSTRSHATSGKEDK